MTDINALLTETTPEIDGSCKSYEFEAEESNWENFSEFYNEVLELDREPHVIGKVEDRNTYFISFKD